MSDDQSAGGRLKLKTLSRGLPRTLRWVTTTVATASLVVISAVLASVPVDSPDSSV